MTDLLTALEVHRAAFTALRHELHAHPETAYEEDRASALIARELESYGLEVHRGLARTGVVAVLRNGTSQRTIGLRADIDALNITELNELPYRSTTQGKMHASAVADVLILHHAALAEARQAYDQHQQAAAALGRELRVLQSIQPILGTTEAQAQDRAAELDAASAHNGTSTTPHARRIVGTPAQVAEQLAEWFAAGAADGFHVWPALLPDGLEQLALELVPELQRRDLFRTAYSGRTLREHLGLSRPASRYIGAPSEAHTAYDLRG